jgi:hypothetical protein
MLHSLKISIDGAAKPRVCPSLNVAVEAGRLDVWLLRHQQKNVRLGGLCNMVELLQDRALDILRGLIDDVVRIDVDVGGALVPRCQQR